MNWRTLRLQALALLLAFAIFAAGGYVFGMDLSDGVTLAHGAVLVAFYFVVFAGVHLYRAIRGEDEELPLDARWRFIAVVMVVLGLASAGALAADIGPVAGVEPVLVLIGLAAALLVGYFGYEAREGYRASREDESL